MLIGQSPAVEKRRAIALLRSPVGARPNANVSDVQEFIRRAGAEAPRVDDDDVAVEILWAVFDPTPWQP